MKRLLRHDVMRTTHGDHDYSFPSLPLVCPPDIAKPAAGDSEGSKAAATGGWLNKD
jgi:hypothetical protein